MLCGPTASARESIGLVDDEPLERFFKQLYGHFIPSGARSVISDRAKLLSQQTYKEE